MAPLQVPIYYWFVLAGVVTAGLLVDLLGHRGDRGCDRRHAILWSVGWILLALAFGGWVTVALGPRAGGEYFTAWLIEKSLSVDNLFVFLVVFERLRIPEKEQHRVLFWGILGAFVTRGLFIAGGTAMIGAWHGIVYLMGFFLILTGIKTARTSESDAQKSKVLAFVEKRLRVSRRLDGHRFMTHVDGRRMATPLLLALIVVEISDVVFAVDSIPAVLAISHEPFIVYASNVFAVLGLRALYLVIVGALARLSYLRFGLAAILVFVGAKMALSGFIHIHHFVSLLVILAILAGTIVTSLVSDRRRAQPSH